MPTAPLPRFEKAKQQSPKDPRPHYLTAVALQKKGDAAGAEKELRAALTLDPKLAEVRNELGALLIERRRWAEAATELKRAVADKPDLAEAWFNLGQAAAMQKDCATSLDAYAHAVKLAPSDADGYINQSVAARKCNKLPEATAAARMAVKLAARSAPAHLNLGIALEASGKLGEAASEYDVATRIKPDYATAWWSLGLVDVKLKKLDRGDRGPGEGAHALADRGAHRRSRRRLSRQGRPGEGDGAVPRGRRQGSALHPGALAPGTDAVGGAQMRRAGQGAGRPPARGRPFGRCAKTASRM